MLNGQNKQSVNVRFKVDRIFFLNLNFSFNITEKS